MENHNNLSTNSLDDNTNKTKMNNRNGEEDEQEREPEASANPGGNPSGGVGCGGGLEEGSRPSSPDPASRSSSRTPFTNLSQIDADLALARTLQEQERAYMMLSMNNEVSDYGSWETESYVHDDEDDFDDPHDEAERGNGDGDEGRDKSDVTDGDDEEDAFDVHAHDEEDDDNGADFEVDPGAYSSDEAYARALQEAEEREMAARLLALAGLDHRVEQTEDHGHNSQDAWEEVDPDELSYEELIALGEVIGTESRGLSADTIASLPSVHYIAGSRQNGSSELCVICRLDYEDGENLTLLPCKHSYHSECINDWLKINKVCPVCSTEVPTSSHS